MMDKRLGIRTPPLTLLTPQEVMKRIEKADYERRKNNMRHRCGNCGRIININDPADCKRWKNPYYCMPCYKKVESKNAKRRKQDDHRRRTANP